MAQGRGYGAVDEKGFVGMERDLDTGVWKAVETKRFEGADGLLTRPVATLPALAMSRLRLVGAIRDLVKAMAGRSDGAVHDQAWDKVQTRLDAEVCIKETDDDPETAAAATRVRAALLVGDGTGQTQFRYRDEVTHGRMQVSLAKTAPLSEDVARCGLGPILKRVEAATDKLAEATGHGDAAGPARARSVQVRAALNGCVAAFNGVHDDLAWLRAHTPAGEDRDTIAALLVPLERLLDDRKGREVAPATADATPGPADEAPPAHG